ncbi:agmatine hydroxycinnamoyltransferase 1-like [Panicum virgatum]|uniref:agmatine hydroxycinnamoyltransferase 1-like n=1 Tax=Panicum virgatum TaxID=38727 RepID=UPI0019D67638|nr:agmatine hydroxycinnamoyltransferase 1-like [Panicum virgatum]
MKITILSSKAVRPAAAASPEVVPLSVFDKANLTRSLRRLRLPPADAAQCRTRGRPGPGAGGYREWAGRLGADPHTGARAILLTDEGAQLVEAAADVPLDAALPLRPTPEMTRLHPPAPGKGGGAEEEPLMLIQLTRYACGGLAVGVTAHHLVSDGRTTGNFLVAWSQATRCAALDPAPVHDRAAFFQPRDPPRVEFEHSGVEFKKPKPAAGDAHDDADKVEVHRAHFSQEFIYRLKVLASSPPGSGRPCSTLRCVVAHLWRCITAARGLDGSTTTSVHIAVDGRARMSLPVPEGYTGNMVLWRGRPRRRGTLWRGRCGAGPCGAAAAARGGSHRRGAGVGGRRQLLRVLRRLRGGIGAVEAEGLVPAADAAEMVLSPDIEVDSWLRIPFYDC